MVSILQLKDELYSQLMMQIEWGFFSELSSNFEQLAVSKPLALLLKPA